MDGAPRYAFELEVVLPKAVPCVLAVGAFLKNTVCLTAGDRAYVSAPCGNLDTAAAIAAFEHAIARLKDAVGAEPVLVAHDLHPDFHSTRWAGASGLPILAVQHHHAHAAAVAAENGHLGPVLGLSLDGFGLGPGNESWGGELLLVDGPEWRRLGHLAPLRQPGGDLAAREPWRMAAAALHRMARGAEIASRFAQFRAAALLAEVIDKGVNSPPTTSCGRLFDAACGLLGVHPVADFEGQAPMALEAMVRVPRVLYGSWSIEAGVLDTLPLLAHLADLADPAEGADLFHGTLSAALAEWVAEAAAETGVATVALGGGCFFNKVLGASLPPALRSRGVRVLRPLLASPGDPAVSLGQAWIAGLHALS
ncbi:MAG: hydrogenase maturation protein HypF [Alphaproteobacteria bacterium]|nr:hydrogenase maturation protein HypF [Alphaproteobacteria bacterium]